MHSPMLIHNSAVSRNPTTLIGSITRASSGFRVIISLVIR
ncbi:MAG: hypothetical protein Ct9H300mP1_21350 [Planctomycetaceae bacterium]|nr:MAG: hypothetical protein Ct9H300mP1_21350 [Planctomycetaceae bacterium]